jgi:hypothetical protein
VQRLRYVTPVIPEIYPYFVQRNLSMRLYSRLLALCLFLPALAAHAEFLPGLYRVSEPLTSQMPPEQARAMQQAFDTLVLRLTGDVNAASNPALAELRKDPQQLVSQYGFQDNSLQVDFDPRAVDSSLRQAGVALWGPNRPSILVWWLNQTVDGATLVGDGQASAQTLRNAAQHRGLPLLLPLADLQEQLAATPQALAGPQPDGLLEVSQRYAADALLAVNAVEENAQWRASWNLWLGESVEQGVATGQDPAGLADAVMLQINQRLAPRFVLAAGSSQSLTLIVEGNDLARFAELERLLEPLGARLIAVQGGQLTYRVDASAEQLRAQLGLLRLQEVSAQAVDPQAIASTEVAAPQPTADVLTFRW